MSVPCLFCGSDRTVPVLYERMDRSWVEGNKFRRYCEGCERWQRCCSRAEWTEHRKPMVLPAGADASDPILLPVEQTEFIDRIPDNLFPCPNDGCSTRHRGYPDECDDCGAKYEWM